MYAASMGRKRKKDSSVSQDVSMLSRSKRKINDADVTGSSSGYITEGRAGRIVRVYLKNFMCHGALEINLDLNTNYIIGRNGSGKSAILTALIVGLGGKARTTNRGLNMKSFIKIGEDIATVEITLSNTGPMAYSPKVYGPKITVIRSFSATGSNNYKLKAANGSVVSTAFREINKLIEFLGIHVDNPVCILNQDVARTFLNSNDPAKKYIMFMKATNLESVKQQYKAALQNKKRTSEVLQTKLDELKKLEVDVKKWLRKYEAFKNVTKVEDRKKKLEVESIWAQINVIENELQNKQDKVTNAEKEVKNFSDLITNKDERKETLSQNIEQIRQQLLEIRNEEEINQTVFKTKKTELQKLRETLYRKKSEADTIETIMKRRQNDKQAIEEEISKSSEFHQNRLKMIKERDQNMITAEKNLADVTKLQETTENHLDLIQSQVNRKSQLQDNLTTELHEVSEKVKQRQLKIRSLKINENNAISIYGNTMELIIQSINAHKEQFKIVPKGPLGSYIKLKDKKWALAIEDFVGASMLMSFCVDNQNDAKILSQIFTEVCGNSTKPTIISSKFFDKVHNYSTYKSESPNGCIAMIDTLIIEDGVVMNCLIDQLSIENILLISDNNLAIQLMSNASNVPKNCSRVITLNGDQYYPDPNYRSYSCRNKNARYLQVSASEAIKIYEEELRSYLENESTVRKQLQAVTSNVMELKKDIRATEMKAQKLLTARIRVERDISDLKVLELPPEPNLQILADEMDEIAKIIEAKQLELERAQVEFENIKKQMEEIETEYKQIQNISKNLETRMRPLIDQLNEAELKLQQVHINSKHHRDKRKQAEEIFKLAKKEWEVKNNYFQKKTEAALKLGARIKTKRTVEVILKELEDIQTQIEDVKSSLGDKLTISQTYMRVQQKYDKTKDEVVKVKNCLDKMIETVESRARHYHRLAEYIGVRVREMFSSVLKVRQFKGTIEIDHEKQTLELVVIPQHGSSQGTGQTHILSGGERSYSTVAFLHALWQVMEYPFYFLDEFDVFMDKVNRRTVMDILLEHAKEHRNLQFVFLTPQDVSNIVGDTKITVHKMADPDRTGRKQ